MAIAAIALNGVLAGGARPMAAAADPFAVICHSEAASPADAAPQGAVPAPAHACDHCNLCAASPAPAAFDNIAAGVLAPARLLHVMRPALTLARGNLDITLHFARGPPAFA